MSSRSARLTAKIGMMESDIRASSKRLHTHSRFPELYPYYLTRLYTTIKASVPMMKCAEQLCLQSENDPVCAKLAEYYAEHAEEEMHHDEWLLDDLEILGVNRREVEEAVPGLAAATLIGTQYYWMRHGHPVSLLGYLAVLEKPMDPEYFRRLIDRWGIPEKAFRTLLLHAELDQDHHHELNQLVDELPLTQQQESMLGTSAIATIGLVANFFNEVVDSFEQKL